MGLKAIVSFPTSGAGVTTVTVISSPATIAAASGITIVVVNVAGPATINLPATPAANSVIVVQDGSMLAGVNNITVQGNGSNINIPTGAAASYVIGENGTDGWFNWQGTVWGLLA